VALLSGCSGLAPDFVWFKLGEPSKSYEWLTVSRAAVIEACHVTRTDWYYMACARQVKDSCIITSNISEAAANEIFGGGDPQMGQLSMREHELKHCEGWGHHAKHPSADGVLLEAIPFRH
jgi:hypothetical protein